MPDLTGLTALDVAVGLFFLFFLLSIVCSTVAELISTAMGWRARNLELGLRQVLGDPERVNAFFNTPRIRALGQPVRELSERWWGARGWGEPQHGEAAATGAEGVAAGAPVDEEPPAPVRLPSYIPSRAFSLAVLDTLAPDLAKESRALDRSAPASQDVIEQLRGRLPGKRDDGVRRALEDVLDEGRGHIDDLREGLERHFDEVMDRASGWYKRRAQLALVIIASAVTIAGNVDAVQVASSLWSDDALRATVVQRATAAAENAPPPTEASLNRLADDVEEVDELSLPVGWSAATTPDTFWGWLGKLLLGWPLTVAAVAMGAPFWFDLLGKVARLRVAGKAEGTVKDDTGRKGPADD